MEKVRGMISVEFLSAQRGERPVRSNPLDLVALLALGEWAMAAQLILENPQLSEAGGGVLHLMAQRNDIKAVKWLLERNADPNARWADGDVELTPLHLAAARGHADVVRVLLAGGADVTIRDTKHGAEAIGWARYFKQPEIVKILEDHAAGH
jgi:ankyrin repeat protein